MLLCEIFLLIQPSLILFHDKFTIISLTGTSLKTPLGVTTQNILVKVKRSLKTSIMVLDKKSLLLVIFADQN